MKNRDLLLSGLLIIGLGSVPCRAQTGDTTDTDMRSTGPDTTAVSAPIVTFIELGSVSCIPCKLMEPVLEAIREEYAEQVKVVFHDVRSEAGKPFAEKYRVRTIPTQIFLNDKGQVYYRHTGYLPKEDVVKILKKKGVN
ncbi:thioredoxin family protein [bacterium]|nr:thioredoxin family protein [bacterium]